jgi:hypothetical protein
MVMLVICEPQKHKALEPSSCNQASNKVLEADLNAYH